MLYILDLVFFAINAALLLIEGYSDFKYKGIPLYVVIIHVALAVITLVTRLLFHGWWFIVTTHWVLLVVIIPVVFIYVKTGLVGEGDLLILAASGLVSPYIPIGYFTGLQIPLPIAIVNSSISPLYRHYKTTSVVYVRGLGKVRVRVRYAVDLKRGHLRNEYPIYIDGYGVVPAKVFKDPSSVYKLVESVPDYTLVYTVPRYPYIYYYSISFVASFVFVTLLSVIIGLVVVDVT